MAGKSIGERAAAGEHEEPEQELFPVGQIEGDGVTLKTLIPAGSTVKHTVSILSAEVPGASGLLNPRGVQRVLIDCELAGIEEVPLREEGEVKEWKVRSKLRPIHVRRVQRGVAGDIEGGFEQLLLDDPDTAGKALDAMRKAAERELATA